MARAKCSMAASDSPFQVRRNPARNQTDARLGLSTSARSRRAIPAATSSVRWASALGDLASAIGHPAVDLAPEIAPRRHRVGRREIRVAHERVVELAERRVDRLPGSQMEVRHAAQIVVVGVEAFGWLALRALDLGPLELRRDRADDGLGDLILQLENIVERAFKALGP